MDLQNEKCVMVIDENLPLGIAAIVYKMQDHSIVAYRQSVYGMIYTTCLKSQFEIFVRTMRCS